MALTGKIISFELHIYKPPSFLEQATVALGDQKRDRMPVQPCELTRALTDSLGARCPRAQRLWRRRETLSSPQFTRWTELVSTEPAINERDDAEQVARDLGKELALRQRAGPRDDLARHPLVTWPAVLS